MNYDFGNRTAFVTGGAKRIGRSIALALAAAGSDVVIHYNRSEKDAEKTCADIESIGVKAIPVQGALDQPSRVNTLFTQAVTEAGAIDILVNSAASFPSATILNAEVADFHRAIDLNALSPLFLSRAFAAQNIPGVIINLLDARITDYDSEHAPYHMAKRSLADLTRMTAMEFAPKVRVNGIAPGLILPPEGRDEGYLEGLAHTNPLNAVGNPDQIAESALFLISNQFITGQIIYVDGGRHMRGNFYGY